MNPLKQLYAGLLGAACLSLHVVPALSAQPQEGQLSLPRDLETIVGDPALLRKPEGLTVACYTFPNYHASALHNKIYSPGWTEYNLIRSARPWFEGHQQPRTPLKACPRPGKSTTNSANRAGLMC